ncbi:MAG: hypothetical protein LBK53_06200 [Heliobacteriaceae bacterium]|jgi:RNA polymerase subunit RPABC4/transcription elongation factor Spt4|nr:hypothetical protein [Heliobacteriaceae bacterium]
MMNKTCKHGKVSTEADFAYCPDCGELIENQWFLSRCACCGIKLKSVIRNGEIVPAEKFCTNCGSRRHVIEQLDKINFINVNFAVMVKTVVVNAAKDVTQSWTTCNCRPKLLQEFR